jgi:TolB-like protein/DNA-binding winged helix-turn-helix (wHTH) protein
MNDSTVRQEPPLPAAFSGPDTANRENQSSSGCYRFESFEIDGMRRELRRHGLKIHLKGRPFTLLKVLVESQGRIVSRDELRQHLWSPDTHVDFDANLTTAFYKVRKALGDSSRESKFIETIPGQGYRFIEPVVSIAAETEKPPQEAPAEKIEIPSVTPPQKRFITRPRAIALLTAAALLLAVASAGYIHLISTSAKPYDGVRLLVLPFDIPSGNATDEQFSDGLNDELITELTRQHSADISVIAQTTAASYKHANKSVHEMAQELKVVYVVEGAVQQDDGHMHISARLVRAADQSEIWAESYDRTYSESLNVESEVAKRIVDALSAAVLSRSSSARGLSRYWRTEKF